MSKELGARWVRASSSCTTRAFNEHAAAASKHRRLGPDRLIDLLALAGTPEEVAEKVKEIMRLPAIGHLVITPQVPGEGFVEREAIFTMFAEEVMARVL